MGRKENFGIQLHLLAPNQRPLCEMPTRIKQCLPWRGSQCGRGKVMEARLCRGWRERSAERHPRGHPGEMNNSTREETGELPGGGGTGALKGEGRTLQRREPPKQRHGSKKKT